MRKSVGIGFGFAKGMAVSGLLALGVLISSAAWAAPAEGEAAPAEEQATPAGEQGARRGGGGARGGARGGGERGGEYNAPEGVKFIADIQYREGNPAWMLDLAMPEELGDTPRPAIVSIHGGGWSGGSKNGGRGTISRYAQLGYVAITVGYRLSGEAPFPACVEDVKCAVRWLRAHAEEYNVDVNRIGGIGHSAGAHLVAFLGVCPNSAGLDAGPYEDQSSLLNAVCGISTPTDFMGWGEDKGERNGPRGLLAGPDESWEERAKAASPITYVSADAPPMLLIIGARDGTVPPAQGHRFAAAMRGAGCEMISIFEIDNAGHTPQFTHNHLLTPMIETFFETTIGARAGAYQEQLAAGLARTAENVARARAGRGAENRGVEDANNAQEADAPVESGNP